jgi:hypothetical protein
VGTMSTKCPTCGDYFLQIGQHWRFNNSHRPNISEYIDDILTGILMGDATAYRQREEDTPYIKIDVINKKYLEYLSDKLGVLCSSINSVGKTSKNNTIYRLNTVRHPHLNKYINWYSSGKKVFPDDLDMTPTILKHWYVCDGNLCKARGDGYVRISANNEINNSDKIINLFDDTPIPDPNTVKTDRGDFTIWWNCEDSHYFFDYIGDMIKGFEYKWRL